MVEGASTGEVRRALAAALPDHALLLESDSPALAPERGTRAGALNAGLVDQKCRR